MGWPCQHEKVALKEWNVGLSPLDNKDVIHLFLLTEEQILTQLLEGKLK